ncbi:unnamed protein product [Effrenium voratum]|nr:unnamed protein product [Effrenium voratum]
MSESLPCLCLVPSDAAGLIIGTSGRGGTTVRQICEESKAQVSVSGERDTPKALSDRIVTIQGTPQQILVACREVIRIVQRSQELDDNEEGTFVTVVPAGAVEHIVGPGGDTVSELVKSTGADVNISRHNINGTELQPVSVSGTPPQMLDATMEVLQLVQELADQGGLTIECSAQGLKALDPRWSAPETGQSFLFHPSICKMRLLLFAVALPILAYWHYTVYEKGEEKATEEQEECENEEPHIQDDLDEVAGSSIKQDADIYGDEFWSDKRGEPADRDGFSWDAGRDELDDFLADDGGKVDFKGDLGLGKSDDFGLKDFGLGGLDDKSFGLGLGPDLDDFSFDRDHRRDDKGKGKGKSKDKGKEREADPKQVFVANVADAHEDDLRAFFEQAGDVERLKVLRNPDGSAKGVCFVTFRTEDQAQKALTFHNRPFEGGNIVVRMANAGKKGEKGDKGEGRGDRFDRDRDRGDRGDRFDRFDRDRDHHRDRSNERFERPDRDRNERKGKGRGKKGSADVDDALEEALSGHDGPLRSSDFDFVARRFLGELRSRDKADGGSRFQEAMDMVLKYTSSKDRGAVRKWTAYVFTLLQKFDPALSEEIREKDQERRGKGKGRGMARQNSEED